MQSLLPPVDRIDIKGLPACDYLIYPVENALADKLCALIEKHDGSKLRKRMRRKAAIRGIVLPDIFKIPEEWGALQEKQFKKLCARTGLHEKLRTINAAVRLASCLINPVINSEVDGKFWNYSLLEWKQK